MNNYNPGEDTRFGPMPQPTFMRSGLISEGDGLFFIFSWLGEGRILLVQRINGVDHKWDLEDIKRLVPEVRP